MLYLIILGCIFTSEALSPVQVHFAVNKCSLSEIKSLIEAKIDVNYSIYGNTPLLLAIMKGHVEIAECLAEAENCDISISEETERQRSPIHLASENGYLNLIKILIRRGAEVNIQDKLEMTPLPWSSYGGHFESVKYLLSHGAAVNASDSMGRTPLFRAAEHQHYEVVQILLDSGAFLIHADHNQWTALFHSVVCGHTEMMKLLLKNGIDVNIQSDDGETVLHIALSRLRRDVLTTLRTGCDVDVYSRAVAMPTQSVHEAIHLEEDTLQTVHLLLDYGADVNICTQRNCAPICLAARDNRRDLMLLFIRAGVNIHNHMTHLVTNDIKHCESACCDEIVQELEINPVKTLRQISQISIRYYLHKPVSENIKSLPLPTEILRNLYL